MQARWLSDISIAPASQAAHQQLLHGCHCSCPELAGECPCISALPRACVLQVGSLKAAFQQTGLVITGSKTALKAGTWTSDHSAKDSTQGSKDRQHGNEVLACSATPEMLKADLDSQTSIRHRNRHVHPAIDMHTSYACILT